jgi:hypothetical protein
MHSNKDTKFSVFNSYYVDDTAFILFSRGELVATSKLTVSHFRRFGLSIHTGVLSKHEASKTETFTSKGLGRIQRLLIQMTSKLTKIA